MKKFYYFLIILFITSILVWMAVFALRPDGLLRVSVFDIGQGDAIFVQTPNKTQMLIDGGPDSTVLSKLGKKMPFFDKTIDVMILTHSHADHAAGLIEVLKRYKVSKIIFPNDLYNSATYAQFIKSAQAEGAEIIVGKAGERLVLDEQTVFDIFSPFTDLSGKTMSDTNESSIVGRLTMGEIDFLLTGDATIRNENDLLRSGLNIEAEVLKVGHHGSRTSSSNNFVTQVSPDYAVISASEDNRYGHPHQETLNTFSSLAIPVLRTDEEGDITIATDGQQLMRLD